jgi:hypothetical protein
VFGRNYFDSIGLVNEGGRNALFSAFKSLPLKKITALVRAVI